VNPPLAAKHPVTVEHHGVALTDDYAWLRAGNWQEVMRDPSLLAPDIRAYLEAENAYTATAMAETEALQATLFAEMRGRIKEDDSSVPSPDGAFAYAMRFTEGAEQPLVVRTARDGSGPETILLDGNLMSAGRAYFRLGSADHSPDHKRLAFAYDDKGSEYYTLHVRDIESGADLADTIEATTGGGVWAADSNTLFYTVLDDNHRPCRIFRHVIGTPQSEDVLVFEEKDPGFFLGVGQTQSARYILIDSHDHETSEVYLLDAEDPTGAHRLIAERLTAEEYSVDHSGDKLYILTNAGGAEDFKIVTAPVASPGRENWVDLVPHNPGTLILGMTVYQDYMVRLERFAGLPRIVVRALDTGEEHSIAFDEEAYSLGMGDGYEFDTSTLRFTYSSMTTPSRVYDYDMATRERTLRKEEEIPSGHNPADYVTRRVMARAAMMARPCRCRCCYRKDTPLDGSAPLPALRLWRLRHGDSRLVLISRLSLVDRGFIYAIAHIRGGKDKGFRWYLDGKREKKTNTFTDFIAAGDICEKASPLAARSSPWGGIAGGMLMGAVANLQPELFGGIIAEVPFVDVLNTMLDDTLPLTPPEWPEWGNPIESAEDFANIASYSPYDNVGAHAYPPILAIGGLTDPRVTYWEPAKWVAKAAREEDRRRAVLLLKTNMDAGHGGASGRFDRLKETAFSTAFAIKVVASKIIGNG
jgi:oligopeptidase B